MQVLSRILDPPNVSMSDLILRVDCLRERLDSRKVELIHLLQVLICVFHAAHRSAIGQVEHKKQWHIAPRYVRSTFRSGKRAATRLRRRNSTKAKEICAPDSRGGPPVSSATAKVIIQLLRPKNRTVKTSSGSEEGLNACRFHTEGLIPAIEKKTWLATQTEMAGAAMLKSIRWNSLRFLFSQKRNDEPVKSDGEGARGRAKQQDGGEDECFGD